MELRKSLEDIKNMVSQRPYSKGFPVELQPYFYFISDSGHCVMCVLECHLEEAQQSDMDDYELPIPIRYVLEKGYRLINGYVVVDAPYDSAIGLKIDEKYYEF